MYILCQKLAEKNQLTRSRLYSKNNEISFRNQHHKYRWGTNRGQADQSWNHTRQCHDKNGHIFSSHGTLSKRDLLSLTHYLFWIMHHFIFFLFQRSPKWLPLTIMLPKPRSMWLEVRAWPARSDLWPQWLSKIWPVQLETTKLVIGFLKMVKFVAKLLQNLIIWLFICECMKMFVPLVVVFAIKHLGMLFIQ